MGWGWRAALAAATTSAALCLASGQAQAGEILAGVYAHDVTFVGDSIGIGAVKRENGVDFHAGYRTDQLDWLHIIGKPHFHLFVSVDSNNQSNFVAGGFDWKVGIKGPFYIRPGMGLAYTDGKTELPPANVPGLSAQDIAERTYLYYHRIQFGSHVLFEPEFAFGLDLTKRLSIEASWTHLSNGQIFHQGTNEGMDDAGIRLNYKLD